MGVDRIHRLLRLILLLQGRRAYTAAELAEELEVSRRTIFRDLNMLELAHIPYYYDPDAGGYRLASNFFLPPINLRLSEALSMLLLAGKSPQGPALPLTAEGSKAAMKLESILPAPVRRYVGSIVERTNVSLGPMSRHDAAADVFDTLAQAIVDRRVCDVVYLSFADRRQLMTRLHPYRLVFQARAWYVIARSEAHGEVRTFKLIRFRKVAATLRKFPPPPVADVEKHFGLAWSMIPEGREYDVAIRFSPKVAGNVAEVQWHPTQQIDWNDDGACVYRARVDGIGEIAWWILGYGPEAEVLKPAALWKKIAAKAEAMADLYHGKARKGGS
ncbi:MAG: helix-turn-helix transcriptional regulator [Phycisphaerae bacterium]